VTLGRKSSRHILHDYIIVIVVIVV